MLCLSLQNHDGPKLDVVRHRRTGRLCHHIQVVLTCLGLEQTNLHLVSLGVEPPCPHTLARDRSHHMARYDGQGQGVQLPLGDLQGHVMMDTHQSGRDHSHGRVLGIKLHRLRSGTSLPRTPGKCRGPTRRKHGIEGHALCHIARRGRHGTRRIDHHIGIVHGHTETVGQGHRHGPFKGPDLMVVSLRQGDEKTQAHIVQPRCVDLDHVLSIFRYDIPLGCLHQNGLLCQQRCLPWPLGAHTHLDGDGQVRAGVHIHGQHLDGCVFTRRQQGPTRTAAHQQNQEDRRDRDLSPCHKPADQDPGT